MFVPLYRRRPLNSAKPPLLGGIVPTIRLPEFIALHESDLLSD